MKPAEEGGQIRSASARVPCCRGHWISIKNGDPYIIHLNIATCKWWLPILFWGGKSHMFFKWVVAKCIFFPGVLNKSIDLPAVSIESAAVGGSKQTWLTLEGEQNKKKTAQWLDFNHQTTISEKMSEMFPNNNHERTWSEAVLQPPKGHAKGEFRKEDVDWNAKACT